MKRHLSTAVIALLATAAGLVIAAAPTGVPSRLRVQSLGANATPPAAGNITASGTITGATLAGAYDAASLTGNVADARLSANVPRINASNNFSANQWVVRSGADPSLILYESAATVDARIFSSASSGGFGWVGTASPHDFRIASGNSTRVLVGPAGNVTVNTPTTGVPLVVGDPGGGSSYSAVFGGGGVDSRVQVKSSTGYALGLSAGAANGNYYLGATAAASPDLLFSNNAGTTLVRLYNSGGLTLNGPTGGDQGAGTINTSGAHYQNGAPIRYAAAKCTVASCTITYSMGGASIAWASSAGVGRMALTLSGFASEPVCTVTNDAAASNVAQIVSMSASALSLQSVTLDGGAAFSSATQRIICMGT